MNNLMQRRRQQMQNMPMPQQDNSFNNLYNLGSAIGGAAFGNIAGKKNDGKYGDSIVAGTGKTDKENFEAMQKYENSPYTPNINGISHEDSVMGSIDQDGDNFVGVNADGDRDWDAIGAFANGYQQASQPDIVGLEQGMQLGKQAIGSGYSFNRLSNNIGYDPNWRLKAGRLF